MFAISNMITALFNLLVLPFGTSHATMALVFVSILTGVGMAFVFKWTSNAKAIKAAKDKLKGRILEMRIYQDHPALIFKGFAGTMKYNVVYLATLIKPFLILMIPVAVVFMQLDERYARAPLAENDETILSVELNDGLDPFTTAVTLQTDGGVAQDIKPVRISNTREIDWRLRVASSGIHDVTLSSDGASYTVPIVAQAAKMIGKERTAGSLLDPIVYPGLPKIPGDSPFKRVALTYPSAEYPFLFWQVHWIVIFLVYSAGAAIILKFIIKFEI